MSPLDVLYLTLALVIIVVGAAFSYFLVSVTRTVRMINARIEEVSVLLKELTHLKSAVGELGSAVRSITKLVDVLPRLLSSFLRRSESPKDPPSAV
ncbi:MAG: hypothetical protein HY459_00425 [Parcubacteria group bacterium]|nr:hypothetical protein [Parcubacteria group bacterium]